MAIIDQVATILNNNYSYSLEEAYNRWRFIAKKKGLLNPSIILREKYNFLNIKEGILEPGVVKKLLGSPSKGLMYFYETGTYKNKPNNNRIGKSCVFCEAQED